MRVVTEFLILTRLCGGIEVGAGWRARFNGRIDAEAEQEERHRVGGELDSTRSVPAPHVSGSSDTFFRLAG